MADKHKHDAAPMVDEVSEFEILEIAVRELAIEKGLFTAEDHQTWTEYMHTLGPLPAGRLVAKAWLDPEYKKLAVAGLGQIPKYAQQEIRHNDVFFASAALTATKVAAKIVLPL